MNHRHVLGTLAISLRQGQQSSSNIHFVMNLSPSACEAADMPSCSPRCLNTASQAALGRSTAWHLPRPRLSKQRGSVHLQPLYHQHICRSKHGGRSAVHASCAGHPAAPLSLDNKIRGQSYEPCQSESPTRRRNAVYALLCIALVLACASHGQPGPAFASLTISSSSLGKDGAPSVRKATLDSLKQTPLCAQ